MTSLLNKGRVGLYAIEVSRANFVLCYVLYGHPNAEKDDQAASRTCDMLNIVMQDAELQDPGPKLIVGDINGPIHRFPSLDNAISMGEWIDVGADPTLNGGTPPEGTCRSSTPGARLNRRDYVFANERAHSLIDRFDVDADSLLPVHSVLKVRFKGCVPKVAYDAVRLPRRLFKLVHDKCVNSYMQDNLERAEEKRLNTEKALQGKVLDIKVDIPDAGPPAIFWPNGIGDLHKDYLGDLSESNLRDEAERLLDSDASNFTPEQWNQQLNELHGHMDSLLRSSASTLASLLVQNDTEAYIKLYSTLIEQATLSYAGINDQDARCYKGRANVNIKSCQQGPGATYNRDTASMETPICGEARRLILQYRRLITLRNSAYRITKGDAGSKCRAQMIGNLRCFSKNVQERDCCDDLLEHFKAREGTFDFNYFTLTKHAERLLKHYNDVRQVKKRDGKIKYMVKLEGQGGHKAISRILKQLSPAPMNCLRRPQDSGQGKPKGSYTSDHKEIDHILHEVWDGITHGAEGDLLEARDAFISKYTNYLPKAPPFVLGDITVGKLRETCRNGDDSAAGLDGWAVKDMALLSDYALEFIVKLLNAIEVGAPWPAHMLDTRAVFLSKDPNDIANPLKYRILKITSGWYRVWASMRNKDLHPWIMQWAPEEVFSGAPGRGAQDAWLNTALAMELNLSAGLNVAGGSIDVYKCFDQINRDLLLKVAQDAGMPVRIIEPYFRYINNLNIRFQVGQRIGPGHRDRCSIPQGCPFSMTMIALLMVPWVNLMHEVGAEPRVLADDLLFSIAGAERRGLTVKAMQASRQFFADLGAKVAVNKCFTFASDANTRRFLTVLQWDVNGLKIPCVGEFRDLGTHLNLTCNLSGATLTERMRKGIDMAKRLRWMPLSIQTKERMVRSNILPASIYGAEAAHINQDVMNRLRSAIASAIGPSSHKRNANLSFCFNNSSKDLDPIVHILYNRMASIRRMMAKFGPKKVGTVKLLITRVNAGTGRPKENARDLTDIGAWKRKAFASWQRQDRGEGDDDDIASGSDALRGPVSFLIQDLNRCGCSLHSDFSITSEDGFCFNFWDIPWQHLKTAAFDLGIRARDAEINAQRTFLGDLPAIDHQVTKAVFNHLGHKEKRIYAHIATGGFWGEDQLAPSNETNASCPHCGQLNVDTTHLTWECPSINQHRTFKDLCDVDVRKLPKAVANGVPPAMVIGTDGAYWEGTSQSQLFNGDGAPLFPKSQHLSHDPDNIKGLTPIALGNLGPAQCVPQATARAICHKLKAGHQTTTLSTPYRCVRALPQEVNVYTDGSWLNSCNRQFALGGAGVWWPGRALNRNHLNAKCTIINPISPAEADLGFYRQEAEGVAVYTRIGGYSGSSTRTELAAGILAACGNGPVFIASDSEVFVNGVNKMVGQVNQGIPVNINFKLISDGDLWEHMYKALCAKGPNTFKAIWVKGHAEDEHVKRGLLTEEQMHGNHKADAIADDGSESHGSEVLTVMNALTLRFKSYVKFMSQVVHHVIEGYLIHRALIDLKDSKASPDAQCDKRLGYTQLAYADGAGVRPLKPTSSVHCHASLLDKHSEIAEVEAFLANLKIQPVNQDLRGLTWLELYILYRIRGGHKIIPDPSNKALPKGTADKQMRAFQRAVRVVVDRTLDPQADAILFKPGPARCNNLRGVGILGKQACLRFNAEVQPREQDAIAIQLSLLNRGGAIKQHQKFIKGEVKLLPHALKLKGKAAWDSNIPTVTVTPLARNSWERLFKEESFVALTLATMLKCPGCEGGESSFKPVFQRVDLDRGAKCGFCLKSTPIRKWTCPCGVCWHTCSTHAGAHKDHLNKDRGKQPQSGHLSTPVGDDRADNGKAKASRRFESPEEIIQQDLRRAKALKAAKEGVKRKADIVFKLDECPLKRPTRLGPILSERFGGASRSSTN